MKRLQCTYRSTKQKLWKIIIYDRDAVSETSIEFDTVAGAEITRKGDDNNPHHNIFPSKAVFTMFLENSDHDSFYDDLVGSREGRFLVYIHTYMADETTEWPMFHGFILQDLSPVEDRKCPSFQITAVDGLQQLQNVRYQENGNPLNNYLIKEYFYNCIKEVKWLDYFMASDDDMVEYAFQWSSQYHAVDAEILKESRLANYFRKFEDGRLLYYTCYEILDDLLKGFNAQLFYHKGRYVIEQVGIKSSDTLVTTYWQSYDSNTTTSVGYTPLEYDYDSNTNISADTYPLKNHLPPLKSIDIRQRGDHLSNVLLPFKWTDTSATETIISSLEDPDGKTRLFFDSTFYAYMENATGIGTELYAKFRLTVRNNTVYATRTYANDYDFKANGGLVPNIYTGESITNITWSGSSPDYIEFWVKVGYLKDDVVPTYDNLLNFYKYMIFQTPPFTSGVFLSINLQLEGIYTDSNFTTAYVGGDTIRWGIDRVNRAYISHSLDDREAQDVIIPVTVNSDATFEIEHPFSMGDYPSSASKQKIQVHNGTTWVDSDGWVDPDTAGNALFQYMAANEIAAMRDKPRLKLDVSLFYEKLLHPIDFRRTIIYKTKRMISMGLTINTIDDTTEGRYFEIDKVYNGTIGDPTTPNPVGLSHTFGLSSQAGSSSNAVPVATTPPYAKEFDNVTNDYIDVSDYDELPDPDEVTDSSIRASILLFSGSAKFRFKNVAKASLSSYQFRINYASKRIEFKKAQNGKDFEMIGYNYYVTDDSESS